MRFWNKKLVVVSAVVTVVLLTNFLVLADWLDRLGVVGWARFVREEYATGTAIAVIVALLILLPTSGRRVGGQRGWVRRCPVCEHELDGRGRYCAVCGSRA